MNMPPELPGNLLARIVAETSSALLAAPLSSLLQYQPAGGAPRERAAAAHYLTAYGLPSAEEQVIITAGGQNALHAILGATLRSGDAVACGRYVYSGFKALAERLGLQLLALPEITAAALDALCRQHRVRAVYLVATNDNPTAATIPLAERRALAEAARRHDLQIIDDDAYGPLSLEAIPPIAAFAPERAWHVASMSKLISPALRVAFVRAPSVGDALSLAADLHETAIMAPPLNAALVTAWLANGTFARLIDAMRSESAARQHIADELLAGIKRQSHPQGYHFWLPLPEGLTADPLAAAMRPTGLSVIPGHRFAIAKDAPEAVRVSLGGLIDRERLARALCVLHGHLALPNRRGAPIV